MTDNETLVFLGTCCILLMLILRRLKGNKIFFSHLIILVSYTLVFVYGLVYKGEHGTSLVWFVSLVFAYLLHLFILVICLFVQLFKKKK